MGGRKEGAIEANKILNRYFEEFLLRLSVDGTKLVVIGYGFRDHHINRVLVDAIGKHSLKFFVVDPSGVGLAKALSSTVLPDAPLVVNGYSLEWIFANGCAGASRRKLTEIFHGESPEYAKLVRFLS